MRPASRPAPGFSADRPVHDAALDPVNTTGNATLPEVRGLSFLRAGHSDQMAWSPVHIVPADGRHASASYI